MEVGAASGIPRRVEQQLAGDLSRYLKNEHLIIIVRMQLCFLDTTKRPNFIIQL